jgi:hypothetical protein
MTVAMAACLTLTARSAQAPAEPAKSTDAVVISSAGLDALLVDQKDQALLRALHMLEARVLELPAELDEPEMPGPALRLMLELLMSPMTFRAGIDEALAARGGNHQVPPFYAQFNFTPVAAAEAKSLADRFASVVAGMIPGPQQPVPGRAGMNMLDLDGVPLYHGLSGADRPAFALALNDLRPDAPGPVAHDLPRGVEPALTLRVDGPALQPLFDMMVAHSSPDEAALLRAQLEMFNLYGESASVISAAVGHGKDRSHGSKRWSNYRRVLESMHMASEGTLTAADLRQVPADATYAQVTSVDISGYGRMLQRMIESAAPAGQDTPDVCAEIEKHIGVHPQRDVLEHLGDRMGLYLSDTTGGGGLLSLVTFIEVDNADALAASLARIAARLNELARVEAKGYVRLSEHRTPDRSLTILTFPGLPIPLELCWSIAGGHLYLAGSPAALLAAIEQGGGGSTSLSDNPRFKEMGGANLDQAIQVTFMDTPRLARSGYGLVSMLMSGLANVVRSPSDPQRDPGVLMPLYGDLIHDARASVMIARLEGDDLVMTSQGDRSFLVNASGAVGAIGGAYGVIAAGALMTGITLPALNQARDSAQMVKSATQLRQISTAMMTYAANHDDQMPASAQALIDGQYFTPDLLTSPFGPAHDGEGDFWIDFSAPMIATIRDPSRRVLGYDRAAFMMRGETSVVFFDGHAQHMPAWQLLDLIAEEPNQGIDFNLPGE